MFLLFFLIFVAVVVVVNVCVFSIHQILSFVLLIKGLIVSSGYTCSKTDRQTGYQADRDMKTERARERDPDTKKKQTRNQNLPEQYL